MKTSFLALLALVMTASLTLAASSFQTTVTDDPPVMDCWTNAGDVNDPEVPPDASLSDCDGGEYICCFDESGPHTKSE